MGVVGEDPGEGHLGNVKWMHELNTGNKQNSASSLILRAERQYLLKIKHDCGSGFKL